MLAIMMFIAFLFARIPSWHEYLDNLAAQIAKKGLLQTANDKERFHQVCAELEKSNRQAPRVDFEDLRQNILKDRFDLKQGSKA
jgi:hypothetical protein